MLGKAPHPYPEQGRRRSFLAHLLPWDAAQIPSCRSLNCKCCRPHPPAEEPETERSVSLRKSQRKGGAAVRTQSPGSSLCAAPPEGDGDRTLMSPCHQHRISWRNHREGRELVLQHDFLFLAPREAPLPSSPGGVRRQSPPTFASWARSPSAFSKCFCHFTILHTATAQVTAPQTPTTGPLLPWAQPRLRLGAHAPQPASSSSASATPRHRKAQDSPNPCAQEALFLKKEGNDSSIKVSLQRKTEL